MLLIRTGIPLIWIQKENFVNWDTISEQGKNKLFAFKNTVKNVLKLKLTFAA